MDHDQWVALRLAMYRIAIKLSFGEMQALCEWHRRELAQYAETSSPYQLREHIDRLEELQRIYQQANVEEDV